MQVIFRNEEKLGINEVVDKFYKTLKECDYKDSEVEALAMTYAKHPVDKFIVHKAPKGIAAQGDILFFVKGSKMYEKYYEKIGERRTKRTRTVLQEGDSVTGDHEFIPIEGSKYSLEDVTFYIDELRVNYSGILLSCDKPFLVFHNEHGNITLPAGDYLVATAINAASPEFTRMLD